VYSLEPGTGGGVSASSEAFILSDIDIRVSPVFSNNNPDLFMTLNELRSDEVIASNFAASTAESENRRIKKVSSNVTKSLYVIIHFGAPSSDSSVFFLGN
jgi:hypothetical protein